MKLVSYVATLLLSLSITMESRASVEEVQVFTEKLKDITRLNDIRAYMTNTDHKPREKTYHEKCVENALKLALRNPDSELSHAVYANIIEERVADAYINELSERCKVAYEKNRTNEVNFCRKQFSKFEDEREKQMKKLWQDDLYPIISKILFSSPDCQIYVPKTVVKSDAPGLKVKDGYVLYDEENGRLCFQGFEIGALTNACEIISRWDDGRIINCRMNNEFLGVKTCSVSYDTLGRIRGFSFSFNPSTRAEYEKTLDDVVNEVRAMVRYKNQSFLFSEKSKHDASFTLNVVKDRIRYIISIDQCHGIYANKAKHFIALRIFFGNEVPLSWQPPKEGIYLGTKKNEIAADVAKARSISSTNMERPKGSKENSRVIRSVQDDDEEVRQKRKQRAETWGRKHFKERSLEQYNSNDQRLRRKQLQEVSMLLAEMAVAYNDKGFDAVFLDGASVINTYYKIDRAAYWSKCYGNNGLAALEGDVFSQEIGTVLDSLKVVFEEAGQIDDLKSRHDKLLLQVRFGVNTLEELQLKIAVRQAFDERVEKERLFQQEERRIQAEEDKANAIRHQTIDLYHHYKW